MIYLDNAATTPIDPRVIDKMADFLKNEYGNPLGKYDLAKKAKEEIEIARFKVAELINVNIKNIIFTSGATESNNFIIKGIAERYQNRGKHIVTTKVEHKSIINSCLFLEKKGYQITYLDVDKTGLVNFKELEDAIRSDTILVSIMWVNNETGVKNDIKKIGDLCKEKNVLFHTDMTQAVGKINIDMSKINADFASFSSHKIYGPKGIGAAYIGNDELGIRHDIEPLIHGGQQEYSLRGGTHNTHNIIGFGYAADLMKKELNEYILHIKQMEDNLIEKLKKDIPNIYFIGDMKNRIPGILSISIKGFNNEMFLSMYSDIIACSSGSACSFGEPSHVIKNIDKEIDFKTVLRISIGKYTEEIEEFINAIKKYTNEFLEV